MSLESTSALDQTFAALADPTRRAILARLAQGDATVNELAAPFDMSLPAVSQHLKVLERAHLITRRKEAQRRPCHLEAERLRVAADWISQYRKFWEGQLDALAGYLDWLQRSSEETKHGPSGSDD